MSTPLSCIISQVESSENLILHVPALHSHKYSVPFLFTLIKQLFLKKQQQNFPILKRRGWLDNTSSLHLKPH